MRSATTPKYAVRKTASSMHLLVIARVVFDYISASQFSSSLTISPPTPLDEGQTHLRRNVLTTYVSNELDRECMFGILSIISGSSNQKISGFHILLVVSCMRLDRMTEKDDHRSTGITSKAIQRLSWIFTISSLPGSVLKNALSPRRCPDPHSTCPFP